MSVLFKGGTVVNATGRYVADVFAAGISVTLSGLPTVHLAGAHVIYGVTLGWLTGRATAG